MELKSKTQKSHLENKELGKKLFLKAWDYEECQYKKEAFQLFYAAAVLGDVKAHQNIAVSFATGDGVEANQTKAIEWYKKAIKKGKCQFSIGALGHRYMYGNFRTPLDYPRAMKYYKLGMDLNNVELKIEYAFGVCLGLTDSKWKTKPNPCAAWDLVQNIDYGNAENHHLHYLSFIANAAYWFQQQEEEQQEEEQQEEEKEEEKKKEEEKRQEKKQDKKQEKEQEQEEEAKHKNSIKKEKTLQITKTQVINMLHTLLLKGDVLTNSSKFALSSLFLLDPNYTNDKINEQDRNYCKNLKKMNMFSVYLILFRDIEEINDLPEDVLSIIFSFTQKGNAHIAMAEELYIFANQLPLTAFQYNQRYLVPKLTLFARAALLGHAEAQHSLAHLLEEQKALQKQCMPLSSCKKKSKTCDLNNLVKLSNSNVELEEPARKRARLTLEPFDSSNKILNQPQYYAAQTYSCTKLQKIDELEKLPRVFSKPHSWYLAAAKQHHLKSMFQVFKINKKGKPSVKKNAVAELWLQRALTLDKKQTMFHIALQTWLGKEGFKMNKKKAFSVLQNITLDLDSSLGQTFCGNLLECGLGTKQDFKKAAIHYKSCNNLNFYNTGEVVFLYGFSSVNDRTKEAIELWTQGAKKNEVHCCYRLGWAYATGTFHLEKNMALAKKWFEVADDNTHYGARCHLQSLKNSPHEPCHFLGYAYQFGHFGKFHKAGLALHHQRSTYAKEHGLDIINGLQFTWTELSKQSKLQKKKQKQKILDGKNWKDGDTTQQNNLTEQTKTHCYFF
jgi:TPR repeat protein